MRAIWNGTTVAESDDTILVEGNHYFPPDSVRREYVRESDHTSRCPWKGTASYLTLEVDGERNENAAWFYPAAKPKAEHIQDHVAFWNGVDVVP